MGEVSIIPAKYLEQEVPDYRGNPLIEALPPIYLKQSICSKRRELHGVRLHRNRDVGCGQDDGNGKSAVALPANNTSYEVQ